MPTENGNEENDKASKLNAKCVKEIEKKENQ